MRHLEIHAHLALPCAAALTSVGCSGPVQLDGSDTGPTSACTGAAPFVVGMEATTDLGDHVVRIQSAVPSPPDVGDNRWVLELVDDGGNAVMGAPVRVRPWMPLHGHGLSPRTYAGEDLGDGRYQVATFDLIMPGTWEFTVDITEDGSETALFALCAEG